MPERTQSFKWTKNEMFQQIGNGERGSAPRWWPSAWRGVCLKRRSFEAIDGELIWWRAALVDEWEAGLEAEAQLDAEEAAEDEDSDESDIEES